MDSVDNQHNGRANIAYNLLDEALLSVRINGHDIKQTLPGLLASLSDTQNDVTLTRLQAHQQHGVFAFLVQLAALAMLRTQASDRPIDEQRWRKMLIATANADGAGEEAYALVVNDLSKPAFFQPPIPSGTLTEYTDASEYISGPLDVLVTSKGVDVKGQRIETPNAEDWVYALIVLQTMEGFSGRGNHGIARMNGGYGSRPCVSFADNYGFSQRFVRDLFRLTDCGARSDLINTHHYTMNGSLGLIWCKGWDGESQLSFDDLDPYFIEICRRIRMQQLVDGKLIVYRGINNNSRIVAGESKGYTGDPWTPVSRGAKTAGQALSVSETGFHYARVQGLMFSADWNHGIASIAGQDGLDRLWLGQVLVRGQGTTGGYHERWVYMPQKVRRRFTNTEQREQLGNRSRAWVDLAAKARKDILKPALLTLIQGAPEKRKLDDKRADGYLKRLEMLVDSIFFPLLFEHADTPAELADKVFEKELTRLIYRLFDEAMISLPVPNARRWRAEAEAYRVLQGAIYNNFKLLDRPSYKQDSAQQDASSQGESV